MICQFPGNKKKDTDTKEVHIRLDMTFDLPKEMAEQLDLWGIRDFDSCEFDRDRCLLKLCAKTTLYQKGA